MTTLYKCRGKTIRPGQSWTDETGTVHPGNWIKWSDEQKEAFGITTFIRETPPDSRLYSWSYNDDGSINKIAKSLNDIVEKDRITEGVKTNLIGTVKGQQKNLLSKTDWAVIRKMDIGTEIPDEIAEYREAIRSKADEMENAISNAKNTHELTDLLNGLLQEWPEL
tara:strand:+ start:107 stop:604 length:498 start_codon:yes stop_codon:yes gene_type:complete